MSAAPKYGKTFLDKFKEKLNGAFKGDRAVDAISYMAGHSCHFRTSHSLSIR